MIDPNDILRKTKESIDKAVEEARRKRNEDDRRFMVSAIGSDLAAALEPTLQKIADNNRITKEELRQSISEIKVEAPKVDVPHAQVDVRIPPIVVPEPRVTVNIPEIKVPTIKIPPIKVPKPEVTVNIPPIKIPEIKVPEQKVSFPSSFKLDNNKENPLPVILTDQKGRAYEAFGGGSAGGGKIKQYQEADTDALITGLAMFAEAADNTLLPLQMGQGVADRALRVVHASDVAQSVSFSGTVETRQVSGSADSVNVILIDGAAPTILAIDSGVVNTTTLRNVQAVDSVSSVYVTGSSGSIATVILDPDGLAYSNSNPFPIVGSISTTPGATFYASDAVGSQNIIQLGGTAIALGEGVVGGGTLRIVQAVDSVSSVNMVSGSVSIAEHTLIDSLQATGSVDSINILQVGGTAVAAGEGVAGAGTLRIVQAVDSTASVNVTNSSLIVQQLSGSANSVYITGSSGTTIAVGSVSADVADPDGEGPLKIGGIARTANPSAVAAGDRVSATFDDLGRQLITPYQVRDLVGTAYVTITTSGETALLAGIASTLLDVMQVVCCNESGAAVNLDFRTGTAGAVMFSVTVPANATAGFVPVVPIPQTEAVQAWTVQNDGTDISNTTVNISALFIKNV